MQDTRGTLREEFRAGRLRFQRGTLLDGGEEIALTPKERGLLRCLATRRGMVASLEDLLEEVWGAAAVGPESVHRAVSTLRTKLALHDAKNLISTVHGIGYRLTLPLRPCDHDGDGDSLASWQAANLVEQAKSLLGRRARADLDVAARMLERAAGIAPDHLPVHIVTAHLHVTEAMRSYRLPSAAAADAEDAARKALAVAPGNAEALSVLGWVETVIDGRETGLLLLEEARENLRGAWLPLFYRSWALAGLGRFREAIADFEEALRLAPLALGLHGAYGYVLLCSGDVPRAHEMMRRAVAELLVSDMAFGSLSIAASLMGRHDEAIAAARRGSELSSHPILRAQLGCALAAAGDLDAAAKLWSELTEEGDAAKPHCHIAALAASLGQTLAAKLSLERAHADLCPFRHISRFDPRLSRLNHKEGAAAGRPDLKWGTGR